VAGYDAVLAVNEDWLCPAKLADGSGDLGDLLVGVCAGVPGVGDQALDIPMLDCQVLARDKLIGGMHGAKVPSLFRSFCRSARWAAFLIPASEGVDLPRDFPGPAYAPSLRARGTGLYP
jgi:hypothetical protein